MRWKRATILQVGLLLCSDKDATRVEYAAAGIDHQLFVSRYLVALPQPERLREMIEADRASLEAGGIAGWKELVGDQE
jgi:hypothetical protein